MSAREVTTDMKLAMDVMRAQGVTHHPIQAEQRECGCRTVSGWDTAKYEPFGGIEPCRAHSAHAQRAIERYHDPEVMERSPEQDATAFLMVLLEEEIERGAVDATT